MSRPGISVVMPFGGACVAAQEALRALSAVDAIAGDELILVDNSASGTMIEAGSAPGPGEVTVVRAAGERSPAHARNIGAARSTNDWILFLDADAWPSPGLLNALWADGVADDVGAVAGGIVPAAARTPVGRYGSARSFLNQQAHFAHPYRPRAAAANLLVRRAAFEAVGGFYEGVRAAEDTDFSWRLQEAGWRLLLRNEATVEHRYRTSLRELRAQWRTYAAGRAWLGRRYDDFVPEPALLRAVRRLGKAPGDRAGEGKRGRAEAHNPADGHVDRARFVALDALLSVEELVGLALSNRPRRADSVRPAPAAVVLVAERFPARGDPLVELALRLERARVEALRRPDVPDLATVRGVAIDYLEDDGRLARLTSMLALVARHPWRALLDRRSRAANALPLRVLAPAARRLQHDPAARLHALGGGQSGAVARRLARLGGRRMD